MRMPTRRRQISIAARCAISRTITTPLAVRRSLSSRVFPRRRGVGAEWRMKWLSTSGGSRTSRSATSGITYAYCATDTECDAAVEVNIPLHPPGTLRLDFREKFPAVHAHAHEPAQTPGAVAKQQVLRLSP